MHCSRLPMSVLPSRRRRDHHHRRPHRRDHRARPSLAGGASESRRALSVAAAGPSSRASWSASARALSCVSCAARAPVYISRDSVASWARASGASLTRGSIRSVRGCVVLLAVHRQPDRIAARRGPRRVGHRKDAMRHRAGGLFRARCDGIMPQVPGKAMHAGARRHGPRMAPPSRAARRSALRWACADRVHCTRPDRAQGPGSTACHCSNSVRTTLPAPSTISSVTGADAFAAR